jgi:hypothetical protein
VQFLESKSSVLVSFNVGYGEMGVHAAAIFLPVFIL